MIEFLIAFFLITGACFALIGSIGLVRFPDVFTRLHGPTKATTLGVGGTLLGAIIFLTAYAPGVSLREILIAVFLFLTAPVSAHLLARAALHRRCHSVCDLPEDEED
jgi:multicomponent K+:H+ antiporter subunit G